LLAGTGIFSRHCVNTGSGVRPASCPIGAGGKVAGAWS